MGRPKGSKTKPNDKFERRNELLDRGCPTKVIMEIEGCSRQAIAGYKKYHGKGKKWKEENLKRQQDKGILQDFENDPKIRLLDVLNRRTEQTYETATWPEQKTLECLTKYNFDLRVIEKKEKLLELFQTYENAKNSNQKLPLVKLEKICGITCMTISRYFKSVGLEPLYGTRKVSSHLSKEKLKLLEEAYHNSELPNTDICGLAKVHPLLIGSAYAKKFGQRKTLPKKIAGKRGVNGTTLTYTLASQVYEAQDLGYILEEVCELNDTNPTAIQTLTEQRPTLERRIMKTIEILYPEQNITKPYLTFPTD
jgi:hypothetical protein